MLAINTHKEQAQRSYSSSLSSRAMIESCKFTTYSFFLFMGRMKVGQIEYPVV